MGAMTGLVVWCAVCLPVAIIVGRLVGRAGDARPVVPTSAVLADRSFAVTGPPATTRRH